MSVRKLFRERVRDLVARVGQDLDKEERTTSILLMLAEERLSCRVTDLEERTQALEEIAKENRSVLAAAMDQWRLSMLSGEH